MTSRQEWLCHTHTLNTKGNTCTCGFLNQADALPTKVLTLSGLGGTLPGAGLRPVIFPSQGPGKAGPEQMNDGRNDEEYVGEGRALEGTQCHPSSQACPFYTKPWSLVEGDQRPSGPMPKHGVSFLLGRCSLGGGAKDRVTLSVSPQHHVPTGGGCPDLPWGMEVPTSGN